MHFHAQTTGALRNFFCLSNLSYTIYPLSLLPVSVAEWSLHYSIYRYHFLLFYSDNIEAFATLYMHGVTEVISYFLLLHYITAYFTHFAIYRDIMLPCSSLWTPMAHIVLTLGTTWLLSVSIKHHLKTSLCSLYCCIQLTLHDSRQQRFHWFQLINVAFPTV